MVVWAAVATLVFAAGARGQAAQSGNEKKPKKDKTEQRELKPHDPATLFTAEQPLAITLTTNLKRIRGDRGENPPWRAGTITYTDSAGQPATVPVKLRTRGIWRLKNCDLPPIRLNFVKEEVKHSPFAKLDKPKLVVTCRDNNEYEQYLLQEFQLYRVYNTLTKYSPLVRLLHVTYVDSASGKATTTRYAYILEDPDQMADRIGALPLKQKGAGPGDLDHRQLVLFGVFEYLIGNTDWSISGLPNVALVGADTSIMPVASDFDFAGAVATRYAVPDSRLNIRSVRDRVYRGYCVGEDEYQPVFELFKQRKDTIYALYKDDLAKLMQGDRAKETLEYFDDGYAVITDPRRAKREIIDRCLGK
jgi:hypothetical protein